MNSWNQNQNQNNMIVGQAQFNPYNQPSIWGNYNTQRLPTYKADPIHGENAAWQFQMGPNSEIYLPDNDEDVIWWIRTDNMGNKHVQRLNVVFPEEPKPIDLNDILIRLNALEEKINAKQNKSNAKRTPTNDAVATTISD